MPQDLTDDKSTLVQVMAWCRQATSHYLNQCWPRSPTPYGVTRPQWVKNASSWWNCLPRQYCVRMSTSKTPLPVGVILESTYFTMFLWPDNELWKEKPGWKFNLHIHYDFIPSFIPILIGVSFAIPPTPINNYVLINTLGPEQNGWRFANNIFP